MKCANDKSTKYIHLTGNTPGGIIPGGAMPGGRGGGGGAAPVFRPLVGVGAMPGGGNMPCPTDESATWKCKTVRN